MSHKVATEKNKLAFVTYTVTILRKKVAIVKYSQIVRYKVTITRIKIAVVT